MDRSPTTCQLLNVWERARSQTQVQRGFTLLSLAVPAEPAAGLAQYAIGRRDQALLDLRERIFGPHLTATAECPACGLAVQVDFSVTDLRTDPAPDGNAFHALQIDGYALCFRLPNCDDLAALDPHADATARKSALLRRCIGAPAPNNDPSPDLSLPETVTAALSRRMAELDPQGEIELKLTCPTCGHRWVSPLDIVSYLWNEIDAWAGRILREVHVLASAYGWHEADILALSPERRQAYLELIRS